MMKRVLLAAFVNLCLFQPVFGQVRSPKHESALHHILAPHRDVDNLEQRFDDLKCALVLIERGQTIGTGFYISDDGDVATASHVLGDRTFSRNPNGSIQVNIAVPPEFFVTNNKGERISIPARLIDVNADSWLSDVARIKTGTKTSCRLQQVDDRQSRPGQHLITLGFPGLSFETLTLYTGIMSARLTTNLPSEFLDTGEAIKPPNEFIRVQMPISPGLSGAPIIDDENRAIAVVATAGGWTQDLDHLLLAFRGGGFPAPSPPPQTPPNTFSFSFNLAGVTAQLAGLFHDYASPGYGDAVPLRYLKKSPQQSPPPASHNH